MLPHTIEKKEMKSLNNFTEEKAAFLEAIEQPEHRFSDTLSFLDTWFEYSPSHFDNNRSEEHTSELQSRPHLVCRLLLEKKKKKKKQKMNTQHNKQRKIV